jgi:hypothetical protein
MELKELRWAKKEGEKISVCTSRRDHNGLFDVGIDEWKIGERGWEYLGRRFGYNPNHVNQSPEWEAILQEIRETNHKVEILFLVSK